MAPIFTVGFQNNVLLVKKLLEVNILSIMRASLLTWTISTISGVTIDPAYASFTESILGSLVPGKRADFVVLSKDIMSVPVNEILATKVFATIIDGTPIYGKIWQAFLQVCRWLCLGRAQIDVLPKRFDLRRCRYPLLLSNQSSRTLPWTLFIYKIRQL